MVTNALFLLIVATLTNNLGNAVSLKGASQTKSVEPRYSFNHPPSAEYYNPIPVAVIYEDENVFHSKPKVKMVPKNIAEKEESLEKSDVNNTVVTTEQSETTPNVTPSLVTKNQNLVKLVPKSRALNNFEIPVVVVYENDSDPHPNRQRTKTSMVDEFSKRALSYAQKQQTSDVKIDDVEEIKIFKTKTEKPEVRSDKKTFKKRTEELDPVIPIINMESYVFSHNGHFRYSYEGGDGTKAFSEGKQITIDDEAGESVKGGFSYKDKEGKNISLTYTADENGYHPVGDHLPTPPPIPPAIARALKYLATATPEPVTKKPEKS